MSFWRLTCWMTSHSWEWVKISETRTPDGSCIINQEYAHVCRMCGKVLEKC